MCVNIKFIHNKALHYPVAVRCGKCPACLQEKANARANRIKSTYHPDYSVYLATLSYENETIPYIKKSELVDFFNGSDFLGVYRDKYPRKCRVYSYKYEKKIRGKGYKKVHIKDKYGNNHYRLDRKFIDTDLIELYDSNSPELGDDFFNKLALDFDKFSTVRKKVGRNKFIHLPDKVAVLYYPDFQRFMKRLRKDLITKYNYDGKFSYFVCGEYGETYQRTHFHVLFFIRRGFGERLRHAVAENWLFSDYAFTYKRVEPAKSAANYVSSYVNSSSIIPDIFKTSKAFKPMWHYSQGFGVNFREFTLESVCEKIRRRNIFYIEERTTKCGVSRVSIPIPYYVGNRYFPKFKGYCRLTTDNVHEVIQTCCRGSEQKSIDNLIYYKFLNFKVPDFTREDAHKIAVSIRHKYEYFKEVFSYLPFPLEDFMINYTEYWKIRASNMIHSQHVDVSDDLEIYDNISHASALGGRIHHEYLNSLIKLHSGYIEEDFNKFKRNVDKTKSFEDLYNSKIKQRKVTASIHCDL